MNKAKNYLIDLIPNWNVLRVLGKSKVVSLTVFMPFIGYLILFNQELLNYLELSKDVLNITNEDAESKDASISRLYYLYFGLMLIGFGSIFFSYFCPQYIKESATEYEFINSELKVASLSRLRKIISPLNGEACYGKMHEKLSVYKGAFNAAKNDPDADRIEYVMKRVEEIENKSSTELFSLVWLYYLDCKKFYRLVITILYGVGFVLVLTPSVQVFTKVCGILLSKL